MIGFASFLMIVELTSTGPKFNSMMLIATGRVSHCRTQVLLRFGRPTESPHALSDVASWTLMRVIVVISLYRRFA